MESIKFNGNEYILWRPTENLNRLSTEILIRFSSTASSGILLVITGESNEEYMMLELHDNSLVFKTRLKGQ